MTMVGLVASLADNKAALGRRYAEWAVSAPTLESAVAAAAMAQDELGHARSTYPVLKALGMEAEEHGVEGGPRRLALLDDELPDWTSFIAANLLVDGVLATFVSACVDSTVVPMAQRARKILQEEGSHRVHAEAWAKRLCRSGERQTSLLVSRLNETWEHAGRWAGPDDAPGATAALEARMFSIAPSEQRALVRDWLTALVAAEGVSIELTEPTDYSRWDAEFRRWEPSEPRWEP
jgi:1,2-phenylacetyl-CoA epoxidase catalytic subunit